MNSDQKPLRVWCLLRDQFAHVKPAEEHLDSEAEFAYDAEWIPENLVKARPDLVLCVNDFHFDVARCLDAARDAGIPSLCIQDGILEWRCQYENPAFGYGGGAPQHQPVLADKIACIGAQSARQIARWGNAHKVEVTGMPRLDHLRTRTAKPRHCPGNRLLVMTAKKPWFTPEQQDVALRGLRDLQQCLGQRKQIEVRWRVTKGLADVLGVKNELRDLGTADLASVLEEVDAVITTPSTAMLEAMLLKRPVAALDYHNVPRFVPTAWTISASDHINATISELLEPPAGRMAFQEDCLADALWSKEPAAARLAELIRAEVFWKRAHADASATSELPANLLGFHDFLPAGDTVKLSQLYPGAAVFKVSKLENLQVRLARAERDNQKLKAELASKTVRSLKAAFGLVVTRLFPRTR